MPMRQGGYSRAEPRFGGAKASGAERSRHSGRDRRDGTCSCRYRCRLLQRLQGDWCCVAWNAPDSVAPNQLCGWLGQEHGGSIPLAAVERTSDHFRFVPFSDSCAAAKISSFDNIISARKQCRRQFETERLGGREIDEQLNFCGLLDRQISQLFAL